MSGPSQAAARRQRAVPPAKGSRSTVAARLLQISDELRGELQALRFGPPVTHVYCPLDYARAPWARYLHDFARPDPEAVLLGMNPGPWGMVQTGIPFGEVSLVRDWLGIDEPVTRPKHEHPARPVLGFACTRSEVSGLRLWGWARDTFETPQRFFERFLVLNYCPLSFMEGTGRNHTPDKLRAEERRALLEACDRSLRRMVEIIQPRFVIGVGAFAEVRARTALEGMDLAFGRVLHPSPASPAANRDWAGQVATQLTELGMRLPKPRRARRASR